MAGRRLDCKEQRPSSGRRDAISRRAVALWLRLLRLTNAKGQELGEELRARDLSPAQFDVIAQIGSSEGLTQRDLAQRLIVTEGNITQLLDKMQQRGLVARHPEGRCNHLWLTEAGREVYRTAVPAQERHISKFFEVLSDEEQGELLKLLRKLHRRP